MWTLCRRSSTACDAANTEDAVSSVTRLVPVHAHLALNISHGARIVASTDATTWSSMSPSETISDGFESPRRFMLSTWRAER